MRNTVEFLTDKPARSITMRSGRLSSSSTSACVFVLVIYVVLPVTLAITTTHHDKPEEAQPIQMGNKMRAEDGFIVSSPLTVADLNSNTSQLETSERQKRLLPYMTFYLEQDFNRPHGQQLPSITPTNFATTGAVKQPTILQQYHNKFTELTNGISYQPATKFNTPVDKIRLTPFSLNNALPGPFLPMRNPPNVEQPQSVRAQVQIQLQPPTKASFTSTGTGTSGAGGGSNKQPNYSAIYDKLSQLKLQQQYQLAQTYTRQYPPQQVLQLQVAHPLHSNQNPPQHSHQANYRKPPPPQQQQQVQQVSYIPIRDYVHVPHKQSPSKTIVQTYTPSSIDIPSPSHDKETNNNDVNNDEGNAVTSDEDVQYEPEHVHQQHNLHQHHHHVPLPVKTYNEPAVKHYGLRVQPQPQNLDEFKFAPVEVKKHVLKPVILVRQKPTSANNAGKPYLILQRKPTPTQLPNTPQQKPYDYELQIPETINFRPIKFNYPTVPKYQQHHHQPPQHQQQDGRDEEIGKIVVESVTPKYIDIIPKYEVKPTLLAYSPSYGKPYKYSFQASGPSGSAPSGPTAIRTVLPQDLSHNTHAIPQPPIPATPHPHIISYQRPMPQEEYKPSQPSTINSQEQGDYVDTEDVKYQKPKYRPTVQVEYADSEDNDEEAPITTKSPEPVYHHRPTSGKYSHPVVNEPTYVTTPTPYPTKVVFTPTVATNPAPLHQHASSNDREPEYQEGSNSLSLILKKLQDTNALPQTLTPDNIDNSIRTLVKILSGLKKTPKFQRPIVVQDDSGDYEGNNEAGVGLGEVPGTVTQIFPENTPEGGTPGTPGVDYPALSSIPQTDFNCKTQRYKGFFGDPDTHCQVWHYCDLNGGQASFLCPNGTIFSQVALTCDWWYNVKCSNTAQLYVLNERLYKYILPLAPKFPEDYSGPLVDRYLALKFQEMEEKMKKERKPNKENSPDEDGNTSTSNSKESGDSNNSSQENETVQDDAEELRKETHRHEASLHASTESASPTHSAPIIVPDESNETTTSAENEDVS